MASQTLNVVRLSWLAILSYWGIIMVIVLATPSVYSPVIQEPWAFVDYAAIVNFLAAIAVNVVLVMNLAKRFKARPSDTIRVLILAFVAFIALLALSLVVEFAYFNTLLNDFLNRSIFVFTALAMINWVLFTLDIFDNGLHYPLEANDPHRAQIRRNWVSVLVFFGLLVVFLVLLTKSVWVEITAAESIFQTLPVIAIGVFNMLALLVKPLKSVRATKSKEERVGLYALSLAGVALVLFFAFYIVHNIQGIGLEPQEARAARQIFYYLSMAAVPAFCTLTYVGIVYPMRVHQRGAART
ncbi:MAG: hypothetical protein JW839_15530 [Candidatus Lokiarchaeota archaeon]|nr:hypothetical protein [Candidatus Lokiarchaeota archaeon]